MVYNSFSRATPAVTTLNCSSPPGAYSDAAHFLANHAHTPPMFHSTVMLLLHEMAKGDASPFAAYIKCVLRILTCFASID